MLRKLFPVAGILGFVLIISGPVTAHFLMRGFDEERAAAAREIIVRVSMINNEIQRERDFVSTFGNARVQDEAGHRDLASTDDYRALLIPEIEALTAEGAALANYQGILAGIAPALDRLPEIRAASTTENADALSTFVAYTDVISALQLATLSLYDELNLPRSHRNIESKLVRLSERLARERGYGLMAMAEAASSQELTRARQSNLAALDQLQDELRAEHRDDALSAVLTPFVRDISQLESEWGVAEAQPDSDVAADDAHAWFRAMSSHIESARLLHTRLLSREARASS